MLTENKSAIGSKSSSITTILLATTAVIGFLKLPLQAESDESRIEKVNQYCVSGSTRLLEEFKYDLEALRVNLIEQEELIKSSQDKLDQQGEDLRIKESELSIVRAALGRDMLAYSNSQNRKIAKLVEVYTNMEPTSTAEVLSSMPASFGAAIILALPKEKSSAVMDLFSSDFARQVSLEMSGGSILDVQFE